MFACPSDSTCIPAPPPALRLRGKLQLADGLDKLASVVLHLLHCLAPSLTFSSYCTDARNSSHNLPTREASAPFNCLTDTAHCFISLSLRQGSFSVFSRSVLFWSVFVKQGQYYLLTANCVANTFSKAASQLSGTIVFFYRDLHHWFCDSY